LTSEKLFALARGCAARAHNASPVFMRAMAECLRQHAADVARLEAAVLGHAATAAREGNVVTLPVRRATPVAPLLPTDGGTAA
jgi:hypothetical protein